MLLAVAHARCTHGGNGPRQLRRNAKWSEGEGEDEGASPASITPELARNNRSSAPNPWTMIGDSSRGLNPQARSAARAPPARRAQAAQLGVLQRCFF
jgi:hypothetical protein